MVGPEGEDGGASVGKDDGETLWEYDDWTAKKKDSRKKKMYEQRVN